MALISKKTVRRWAYSLAKKGLVFDGGSYAELGNTVTYKGLPPGLDYNLNEETLEFQFIVPAMWADGTIRTIAGYVPGQTATFPLPSSTEDCRVFLKAPFGVNLAISTTSTFSPPPTVETYEYFATRLIVTGGDLEIVKQSIIDADPDFYNLPAEIDVEGGSSEDGWLRKELFHISKIDYVDRSEPWEIAVTDYRKLIIFNSDNSAMTTNRNNITSQGFRTLV